jgi:hypothetical protein
MDEGLKFRHLLAGLEAGVMGALLLLACMMLGTSFDGHSIWLEPNLFATTFYGSHAYEDGFFHDTWAGVALVVLIYGLLGAVWGAIWRERNHRALSIIGAVTGIVVYYAFFHFIWNHVNGLLVLYTSSRPMAFGHVLWGLMLSKSPAYARRIAAETLSLPETPSTGRASDEIRTGEVIQ